MKHRKKVNGAKILCLALAFFVCALLVPAESLALKISDDASPEERNKLLLEWEMNSGIYEREAFKLNYWYQEAYNIETDRYSESEKAENDYMKIGSDGEMYEIVLSDLSEDKLGKCMDYESNIENIGDDLVDASMTGGVACVFLVAACAAGLFGFGVGAFAGLCFVTLLFGGISAFNFFKAAGSYEKTENIYDEIKTYGVKL